MHARSPPTRPLPSPQTMTGSPGRLLSASPEPMSITSSMTRPDSQPPPRPANPSIVSSVPSRPGAPFAQAYHQNFSPQAHDTRQYYLPPKAPAQAVPLAPYHYEAAPPQRAPSKGKGLKFWKSSKAPDPPPPPPAPVQAAPSQFLMPPGASGVSEKKKKKGIFSALIPKWGPHPDYAAPPLPNGRVVTNLDDPDPENRYRPPPGHLAPMVPQTPTVYNTTIYEDSVMPDDETGTTYTRRTRASRVPHPPASSISRRSRRTGRKVPPPPSTAGVSWVTYAKWKPNNKRDTTVTADQSEWTDLEHDLEHDGEHDEEHSMYPRGGTSVVTGKQSMYTNGDRSEFFNQSLASRPQTPDPSQVGTPPVIKPAAAPSETVPSHYPTETIMTEGLTETDERATASVGRASSRRPRLTRSDNYVSEVGTEEPGQSPTTERSGLTRSGLSRSILSRTRSLRSRRSTKAKSEVSQSAVTQSVVSPTAETEQSVLSPGAESEMLTPGTGQPFDARGTVMSGETEEIGLESEVGTVGGGLSRTNTVSKFTKTPDTRRLTIADQSVLRSSRVSGRTGGSRSARSSARLSYISSGAKSSSAGRVTRSNTKQNQRPRPPREDRPGGRPFSRRILDPKKRFSHRPFHYFNRYPPPVITIEPAITNRNSMSTNTTRTYIPSRIGRIRRLVQDFVDLPWRGDSDYYGGSRGITATVHFRSRGGMGGGVSARPQRDSNIPRVPWYRPKQQPGMIDLGAENGLGLPYPGHRTGLNSGPLTDGSERNTIDRVPILPASASPFVSPFPMRSPYDTPESPILGGPVIMKGGPSPLGNQPATYLKKSSSTSSAGSRGQKYRPHPHAILDSYNHGMVVPPPMPIPGPPPPPTAFPVSMMPPSNSHGPRRHKVPAVPSTAFQSSYWSEGDRGMSMATGVMVHAPGQEPALYPYPVPSEGIPSGIYYNGPVQYAQQHHRSRTGVPVTIHATGTSATPSPQMRARGMTATSMNTGTDYMTNTNASAVSGEMGYAV